MNVQTRLGDWAEDGPCWEAWTSEREMLDDLEQWLHQWVADRTAESEEPA